MQEKNFNNPVLGEGYYPDMIAIFKEEAFWGIRKYIKAQEELRKANLPSLATDILLVMLMLIAG